MHPLFVPSTKPPTHFGRFRAPVGVRVVDERGAPFLVDELGPLSRIIVEQAYGADLHGDPDSWSFTDITADVMYSPGITITVGRADETSQAAAAACAFNLDNDDAAYSAYNPASRNWPWMRQGTPTRISVDPGTGIPIVMFQGEMFGATPAWDTSCNLAIVQVTANGVLRRIGRNKAPARSALFRANSGNTMLAYWAMEDGSEATAAAAATPRTPALVQTGSGTLSFGATGAPGADGMIDFTGRGSLSVAVPSYSGTSFQASFTFHTAEATQISQALMLFTSTGLRFYVRFYPTLQNWFIWLYSTSLPSGSSSAASADSAWVDGDFHTFGFSLRQVGADIQVRIRREDSTESLANVWTGETLGQVRTLVVNPPDFEGGTIVQSAYTLGHLAISTPATVPMTAVAAIADAASGYTGELAHVRLARVCAQEGIAVTIVGTSNIAMGPQPLGKFIDILRDIETTDGGLLYDGAGPGLTYVCRSARYNLTAAMTLDVDAGDLDTPFNPVDDDQRVVNDMTVTRPNGGSGRATTAGGPLGTDTIGTYEGKPITANTSDDTPLDEIAGWNLHLGQTPGLRYPNLGLDLAANPHQVPYWLAAAPFISQRADVINISQKATQHPPDDVAVLFEGHTQTMNPRNWKVKANCSRYGPWQVATWGTSRYDSGTSTLALPAPAGATSLSVLVGDGTLWVTGDVDFDIWVDAIHYHVSHIDGPTTPQTFTVGAPLNGVVKDLPAGVQVRLWDTPVYAL
jgi:hypothetical protein